MRYDARCAFSSYRGAQSLYNYINMRHHNGDTLLCNMRHVWRHYKVEKIMSNFLLAYKHDSMTVTKIQQERTNQDKTKIGPFFDFF